MLNESHPLIRQALRFCALPYCYTKLINWKLCKQSKARVAFDLMNIFFKLKYFPDNYSPCRFWEQDPKEWVYYYGSCYHPQQRARLRKNVQPFDRLIVFNDKVLCEQFCRGMNVQIPESFGVITPDMEYKKKIHQAFTFSLVDKLIIKPILGRSGSGIVMATRVKNKIFINNGTELVSLDNFQLKTESLLQAVVPQHSDVAKFSNTSVNTIRVMTLYTKSEEAFIASAFMRFGVGKSFVDNWSAGGVAVGVNHHLGTLKERAYNKHGEVFLKHPGTDIPFNGFQIPFWEQVVEMSTKVQTFCHFHKLLGLDIAITPNGPVLIEINAQPDTITQEQTSGPLLKDPKVLYEFSQHDLLINRHQKNLALSLIS